jgi:formylglycine-generating enzyme
MSAPDGHSSGLGRALAGVALAVAPALAGCSIGGAEAAPREEPAPAPAEGLPPAWAEQHTAPPPQPLDRRPSSVARVESPCPFGMRWIPGGTLSTLARGRDVTIAGFCLDEREVTVGQFRACTEESGCRRECKPGEECPAIPKKTAWQSESVDTDVSRLCNGHAEDREGHPVNCVSIGEAQRYCAVHDKRLPTGDEWEWAATGGPERSASPWGSPVATDQICWGKPKRRAGTCDEGAFASSDRTPQGVLDMGGNLTEWTTAPARSGAVGQTVRWAYGASWYARDDGYARRALGGVQMPAERAETVGFRCAR